jgi:hypothetical protein
MPETIVLGFPTEVSEELYSSEIMDENNGPIAVQSSRVFWDKKTNIQLNNSHNDKGVESFYDKIKDVESRICEQISKNSESWFGTELDYKTVLNSLFNTALKVPSRYNEPFSMYVDNSNPEIVIYDAKKRPRTKEDIDGEVTVLLHAKRIIISSMSAYIEWEILQVLIHKKKSTIKLSELSIREEPEEHVPVGLFKKSKTKKESSKNVVENPNKIEVENENKNIIDKNEIKVDTPNDELEIKNKFENVTESDTEDVVELEPTPPKFILEE